MRLGQSQQAADIDAGREAFARAAYDHGPQAWRAIGLGHGRVESVEHGHIDGVALVGSVEHDLEGRVTPIGQDQVAHGCLPNRKAAFPLHCPTPGDRKRKRGLLVEVLTGEQTPGHGPTG